MRIFRYLLISLLLVTAGGGRAQESNANANVVFAQAIQIYTRSQDQDEAGKKQAAIEILRLFDLISSAYPNSIPGQRLQAGTQVGPIDIVALRKLAGLADTEDNNAPPAQEPVIETAEAEVLEWYQKIVLSGSPEGGFSHGEYPSVGQRTHPGIDLTSACGAEITTPVDAMVTQVIKAGDPAFPQTGNAIILRYQTTSLAYFFLGAAPTMQEGEVTKGQAIGTTGPLHDSETCGTHFEVRLFEGEDTPILPLWHNVLAVGNWRDDPAFISSWRNPEEWLVRLDQQNNFDPMLLLQKDGISIYYSRFLGAFNQPTRLFRRGSKTAQGLTLDRSIIVTRTQKKSLRLELNYLFGRVNRDATESVILATDRLRFRFRATLVNSENPDEIIQSINTAVDARLANSVFTRLSLPAVLSFSEVMLQKADGIRLELLANDGKVFSLGPDIFLETVEPESRDLPDIVAAAERFLTAFSQCPKPAGGFEGTMSYSFSAFEGEPLRISQPEWIDYSNAQWNSARSLDLWLSRGFANCDALEIVEANRGSNPYIPFEIVLGNPAQ